MQHTHWHLSTHWHLDFEFEETKLLLARWTMTKVFQRNSLGRGFEVGPLNGTVERNSLEVVEVGHLRWDNRHSTHLGTPVHSGMPHFVLCCESKHKYKYNQRYKYKYRANTNIKQRYKYKYTLLRTLPCCEWTMHIAQLLCTLPGDLALVMHTFTLPSLIGTLFYKHSFLKFVKVFLTCTQKCHIQSS